MFQRKSRSVCITLIANPQLRGYLGVELQGAVFIPAIESDKLHQFLICPWIPWEYIAHLAEAARLSLLLERTILNINLRAH